MNQSHHQCLIVGIGIEIDLVQVHPGGTVVEQKNMKEEEKEEMYHHLHSAVVNVDVEVAVGIVHPMSRNNAVLNAKNMKQKIVKDIVR